VSASHEVVKNRSWSELFRQNKWELSAIFGPLAFVGFTDMLPTNVQSRLAWICALLVPTATFRISSWVLSDHMRRLVESRSPFVNLISVIFLISVLIVCAIPFVNLVNPDALACSTCVRARGLPEYLAGFAALIATGFVANALANTISYFERSGAAND
jgi:hypothetical protein